MDVIYTDKALQDLGVLQGFSLDVDVAKERDFEIKVPSDHTGLQVKGYWYIDGMEYGGRIDKIKVDTDTDELIYSGRNWRGILDSKVVCPPPGESHRYLSGSWRPMLQELLEELGLSDLFMADNATAISMDKWKVDRYVTLLDMLDKLLDENGHRLNLWWSGADNKVRIGAVAIRDLTDEVQYETGDHVGLVVEDNQGGVNHLICIGQGELEKREVIHLYCTRTGGITETAQYYTGLDEIQGVYENTSAATRDELKKGGFDRLKELKNAQAFSVKVEDYDVQIGDIVGGVERITGIRVSAPITNIIFKINDGVAKVEYQVGDSSGSGSSSGSVGSGSSTGSSAGSSSGGSFNGAVDPLVFYPVGSIYMSVNATSPATLFGGTWEQLKGRFLLGEGDGYSAGSTGGEAAHKLTANEMPKHSHGSTYTSSASTKNYSWFTTSGTNIGYGAVEAGGDQAHNNMPPYLTVYMWKRVG